jgi:LssY C-terminus
MGFGGESWFASRAVPVSNTQNERSLPTWARIALGIAFAYLVVAYLILPRLWKHHETRHAVFDDSPRVTHTGSDIPGDPLNIALVGTEEEVIRAMIAARWDPADALTFRSSVRIVVDTVLKKSDDQAPVSNLYLFGRKEDLAFEKPVGNSPKERHHVRFWKLARLYDDRPAWIGSAAYDIGVELSRTTGQVTHHISPDIDAERDLLVADLKNAIHSEIDWLDGFHSQLQGRNGGGDPWRTDGRLAIVIPPLNQGASSPTAKSAGQLP